MYQASCASTQNRVNPSYSALRNAAAQNKKRIRSRHQVKKYCGNKKDFIMNNAKNNKHAPSQITKKHLLLVAASVYFLMAGEEGFEPSDA